MSVNIPYMEWVCILPGVDPFVSWKVGALKYLESQFVPRKMGTVVPVFVWRHVPYSKVLWRVRVAIGSCPIF